MSKLKLQKSLSYTLLGQLLKNRNIKKYQFLTQKSLAYIYTKLNTNLITSDIQYYYPQKDKNVAFFSDFRLYCKL
jgi:hypothetical protein